MKENNNYLDFDDDSASGVEENKNAGRTWVDILRQIISLRRNLYKAGLFGILLGVCVALSMPKKYTVTVSLSPEMGDSKMSGGLASMAASFLGTAAGQSGPDALNALLAPNIVASTPFLLDLLNSRVITEDGKIDTTLTVYLDQETIPWWIYVVKSPRMVLSSIKSLFAEEKTGNGTTVNSFISLTREELNRLNKLRSQIIVDVDSKTTITSLSITLQDPQVTAIVADSVVLKLQNAITEYRISKAKDDTEYWEKIFSERQQEYISAQKKYAQFVDSNSNVVFQSTLAERERLQNEMSLAYQMYNQVSQQLQMARAKIQESKPAFAILEPAVVPIFSSSTSNVMVILFVTCFVLALYILWSIYGLNKYFMQFKEIFNK